METRDCQPQGAPAPSRRAFLERAAGTGLAAAAGVALLAGASEAGMQTQAPGGAAAAAAPSASDLAILNYALTLERLESTFYNMNGDKTYLGTGTLKSIIDEIRQHENEHVMLLLGVLGANAAPAPQFQGLDAATVDQFLMMSQTFEDVGVSAYLGQAPMIQDPTLLATAAGIMDIEARHAGGIRDYRKSVPSQGNPAGGGDPADTLTEDSEAVNRARTMAEVLALIAPFIAGGATPTTTPTTTPATPATPTTTPAAGGTSTTGTGGTSTTGTAGMTATGTGGTAATGTGGTPSY